MFRPVLIIILLALLLSPIRPEGAVAQSAVQGREYDQCIELAMREPEIGFERAMAWRDLGGGIAARHCVAVALYGLGHFGESALRLERLVQENADAGLRISLLGQAGTFERRAELTAPRLAQLAELDDGAFRALFSGSPIKRTGRDRFLRNVMIAIGNSGDGLLAGVAEKRLSETSPLVRAMAVWALARLAPGARFEQCKAQHLPTESDPETCAEWRSIQP